MTEGQAAALKVSIVFSPIMLILFICDWKKTLLMLAVITVFGCFAFIVDRFVDWVRS